MSKDVEQSTLNIVKDVIQYEITSTQKRLESFESRIKEAADRLRGAADELHITSAVRDLNRAYGDYMKEHGRIEALRVVVCHVTPTPE